MKNYTPRRIIFSLLVLIVAISTWNVARAYIIYATWATESATYRYHSSLPTAWQSPTNFGGQVWTNVLTSSWTFVYNTSSGNEISYGGIDGVGNLVGQTTPSFAGDGHLNGFDIKFDSAESWYTGSGTPGSNQIDARSVSAHEFGHGLGLDHPQSQYCPTPSSNPARATMCQGAVPGTTFRRTLATDDKNGVSAAYPSIVAP